MPHESVQINELIYIDQCEAEVFVRRVAIEEGEREPDLSGVGLAAVGQEEGAADARGSVRAGLAGDAAGQRRGGLVGDRAVEEGEGLRGDRRDRAARAACVRV